MKFIVFWMLISFLGLFSEQSKAAPVIPDNTLHKAFLYNEWHPRRPNVVLFLDPLCPYCKKVIPKLNNIADYNLFVFWSPILGPRSQQAVQPYFECARPTSPQILAAMLIKSAGTKLACEGKGTKKSRDINDALVASYNINAVPAFYLQGKLTSYSLLVSANSRPARIVNDVVIDWDRYRDSELLQQYTYHASAIFLPLNDDSRQLHSLISKYKPRYVFTNGNWDALCKDQPIRVCQQGSLADLKAQRNSSEEFLSLLGLKETNNTVFLISNTGVINEVALN